MTQLAILHQASSVLYLTLLVALPGLLVAAAIGLTVGLLQAVTQVQDQTLPQAFKVAAVWLTLLLTGSSIAQPLIEQARQVFDAVATVGR